MERSVTNCRALYEAVTAYIDSNKHSRDVAERWLCSVLEPRLGTISAIMNSRPRADDQPAIEAFRASELAKEISSKRSELERLERDLEAAQKRAQPVAA